MKKYNKKLISSVFLMLVLTLVTPLLALAKSGNSLQIQTKDPECIIDYWKISDEDTKNPEELIKEYTQSTDDQLNEKFGQKQTSQNLEQLEEGIYQVTIDGLEKGSYLLRQRENEKEIFVPIIVNINEKTENPLVLYPKTKPNEIVITKRDQESKETLAGVGFQILDENGNILTFTKGKDSSYEYSKDGKEKEVFTNTQGKITIKGLENEIKIKETTPLNGYEKNKGKESDKLKPGDSIDFYNQKDKKTNKYSFKKIDGTTKDPLQGAIFKVQMKVEKDGKKTYKDLEEAGKIYTITSDKEGNFKTKDLEYGEYRLVETQAPKGYDKKIDAINFTISETSHQKTIYIKNYKDNPTKKLTALVNTGDKRIFIPIVLALGLIVYGVKKVRKN